ncbi:MAG: SCO6880 family protein [Acidimicrobiales bacterium]
MAAEGTRYRFGPLERRGLVAGWRGGQIASVAGGLVVAVLVLRSRPTPVSVVVALVTVVGGIAFACWPVGGRTGEEWLPTVARWEAARATGSRRHRSAAPAHGHLVGADGVASEALPTAAGRRGGRTAKQSDGPFGDLEVLSAGGVSRGACGVVVDRRARTYTAVLALRGHSFALLDPADKERRVAGWAGVLASLARPGSAVHRVQWLATTVPDDGKAVREHLAERAELGEDATARRSYSQLLDGAGASTCRHEAHLAVQVSAAGQRGRALRSALAGDAGGCAAVLREADALRRLLSEAEALVEGILSPRQLAGLLRRGTDAGARATCAAGGGRAPGDGPGDCRAAAPRPDGHGGPWPMAVEAGWGSLRTDGSWHATYWIAEWPRVDVGPDFLAPLLLGTSRRTVSVVMEPLSPQLAIRQVEQARTADLADSELRRRGGFLPTARRAREEALVTRREEELADGHASLRFSGYVTVTASSRPLLDDACEETEQAAGQCRLELRRLFGDQDRGFATSLPLCRGLS